MILKDLALDPAADAREAQVALNRQPVVRGTHLINRSAVRDLALVFSRQMRAGRFTRVSESFLDGIEDLVRASVASRVHRAPGVGKTLLVAFGLSTLLVLTGCVTGQRIITGPARAAVPVETVAVSTLAPAGAVELGIVTATAEGNNQTAMDLAVGELKKQAAGIGANVLVIGATGTQTSRGNSGVGVFTGGIIFQPSTTSTKTTVEGKAFYVAR